VTGAASGEDLLYLTAEDVLALYAEIFSCTEGEAADQLRDVGGLSALSRPAMHARYEGADLAIQAAVLARGIAEGQYFVDGNKRTALAACLTFLRVNGYDVKATQRERATWILQLHRGRWVEHRLALRIRNSLRRREDDG
jgi:death-on-curing protein